jgi:hypothetical protein
MLGTRLEKAGGGVIGLVIGLIGTGVQLLWPEQRRLGLILLIVGSVIAFAWIIWTVAQWAALRQKPQPSGSRIGGEAAPEQLNQQQALHAQMQNRAEPHTTIAPVFNVGTIQQNAENVRQIQENLARQSYSQPHIEFTNPVIRTRWIKPYGGLVKESPEPHLTNVNRMSVMLARFYYKDERNVPPEIKVTAKIAIGDATGNPIKARYDGAWDEFTESEYRRFATAQTRELIVALMPVDPNGHSIMTWGFGRNAQGFDPDCEALSGEAFVVAIDLIGKHQGEIVLQKPLRFRLTLDPPDLRLED